MIRTPPVLLLAAVALTAGTLYAIALAAVWFLQERLLFHPTVLDPATVLSSEPDVEEQTIAVPGAYLSVLHLRLPDPKGVIFFLHGNAGSLQGWFVDMEFYRRANYDLVMMDYRGYGKSTGRIESEAQLHADVRAVWEKVAPEYRGKRVVLYGRSLGTGLTAELAAEIRPDLIILASPYVSMAALAHFHYPWVPGFLLRYPLPTDRALARGRTRGAPPVLLLHGDRDDLIPIAHSRSLLSSTPGALLLVIAGAGHNDLQEFETYREAIRTALREL